MTAPTTKVDATLLERRQRLLGPAYRLFYDEPLHIVRGEGVWLTVADGRRYLDLYNNVPHVGHCRPEVVEAICRQAAELNTHTRYLHSNVVDYAERLLGLLPDDLNTVMFSCTGTEANELALRIAREVTNARGIIVTEFAYHGNSQLIADISTEDTPPERRPDYVETVPFPDCYRGIHRDEDAAERYAAHIDDAVARLAARGIKPAAFVVDTISSSSGVVEPPAGYLQFAAARARAAGALLIADEVQPGFGRTGRHFWGFEADKVVPDITTMGKPMGNGHPLAATVVRRELLDAFAKRTGYFNTFGGNPVSAAAGLAVLDVIESDGLQKNALQVGSYLRAKIESLSERFAAIGDVRGHGLFLAIDLVRDRQSREPATALARTLVNGLKERGVLTNTIGPHANVLKLRPPMVFSADNADTFLQAFAEALEDAPA
ncbi:MAG: aminotransferase class III-fold pyridoxal phosphate-dependent enzyme [Woeseia sp.]|nr:aminotransferase class III-fold pyridoxal phosphate-dependent enzyme [Woeseia sp.]NNE60867.1 aminotransferase class III-fold pyridoxal phosphate-dependent enzyme [Woeseia sp.]NNL55697.1 aminotransferase class III-fold pyridoxal phosphate-dependent enzyme [Woeseia sp.]